MIVLSQLPIFLTSDREWAEKVSREKRHPGEIIILPEDAVLVAEELREVEVELESDDDLPF